MVLKIEDLNERGESPVFKPPFFVFYFLSEYNVVAYRGEFGGSKIFKNIKKTL